MKTWTIRHKKETSSFLSVSCLILLDSESLFVIPRVPLAALLTESKVANVSLEMESTNINLPPASNTTEVPRSSFNVSKSEWKLESQIVVEFGYLPIFKVSCSLLKLQKSQ